MIVALVGIDGCGKSTVGQWITAKLREYGRDTLYLEDPGGTPLGDRIREILLDPEGCPAPLTETLLFFAARSELWHRVINPAVQARKDVVLARWWFCTAAYQGSVGISNEFIRMLADAVCPLPLDPRLCFWLDVPVDLARVRVEKRSTGPSDDRYEALDRARRLEVKEGYARLANEGLLVRIDAERSPDEVTNEVWARIREVQNVEFPAQT